MNPAPVHRGLPLTTHFKRGYSRKKIVNGSETVKMVSFLSADNSGDSCRENHYAVGHYEILGYGVPQY